MGAKAKICHGMGCISANKIPGLIQQLLQEDFLDTLHRKSPDLPAT